MTLDEAIAHARDVASEQRMRSGVCTQNGTECDKFSACLQCAEEHEQLAEWMEELKAYRAIGNVYDMQNLKGGITHCKDCQNYEKGFCHIREANGLILYREPDDFCKYGIREIDLSDWSVEE